MTSHACKNHPDREGKLTVYAGKFSYFCEECEARYVKANHARDYEPS